VGTPGTDLKLPDHAHPEELRNLQRSVGDEPAYKASNNWADDQVFPAESAREEGRGDPRRTAHSILRVNNGDVEELLALFSGCRIKPRRCRVVRSLLRTHRGRKDALDLREHRGMSLTPDCPRR